MLPGLALNFLHSTRPIDIRLRMLRRAPFLRRTFATTYPRTSNGEPLSPFGIEQQLGEDLNPPPAAYEPPPVTLDSLTPLIPATPLTNAGNSSSLARVSLARWGKPTPMGLKKWKEFDKVRAFAKKGAVDGLYPRPSVQKGLVGEVRRLTVKNGSATEGSLRKMVDGVKIREPDYVGPQLAGPQKDSKKGDKAKKGTSAPVKKKK